MVVEESDEVQAQDSMQPPKKRKATDDMESIESAKRSKIPVADDIEAIEIS